MRRDVPTRREARTAALEAHYSELLAKHAASGLSLRQFAVRSAVSPWTLYEWRRRLKAACAKSQAAPPQLVAVDMIGADARSSDPVYEIVLPGGTRLRLLRDFEPSRVVELLAALRPC